VDKRRTLPSRGTEVGAKSSRSRRVLQNLDRLGDNEEAP